MADEESSSEDDYGPALPRSWLIEADFWGLAPSILVRLSAVDVLCMRQVHSKWAAFGKSDELWRVLYGRDYAPRCGWPDLDPLPKNFGWMHMYSCKHHWFHRYYPMAKQKVEPQKALPSHAGADGQGTKRPRDFAA